MMEGALFCEEETTILASKYSSVSCIDENLIKDNRVLKALLETESKYVPESAVDCHTSIQSEIKPEMRRVLTLWMMDVCEELKCEEATFPLAVNYLDRCLSKTEVKKSQLQLLGAVSLLIASKVRQCDSIAPETLVHYTDYSVTIDELLTWELYVLSKLEWDLASIVATDFIDHLLTRLSISGCNSRNSYTNKENDQNNVNVKNKNARLHQTIRRHTSTLITLCSTECKFSMAPPSVIAAASLFTATKNVIGGTNKLQLQRQILDQLNLVTGIEVDCLRTYHEQIEEMMASYAPQPTTKTKPQPSTGVKKDLPAFRDLSCTQDNV